MTAYNDAVVSLFLKGVHKAFIKLKDLSTAAVDDGMIRESYFVVKINRLSPVAVKLMENWIHYHNLSRTIYLNSQSHLS